MDHSEELNKSLHEAGTPLSGDQLDAVAGGKADGEWEYLTATNQDLAAFGSSDLCPYCREAMTKMTDYYTRTRYYACQRCRIQWQYQIQN